MLYYLTVDEVYNKRTSNPTNNSLLYYLINYPLENNKIDDKTLFSSIYTPIKEFDSAGNEVTHWHNVGMNPQEIMSAFYAKFYNRFFSVRYNYGFLDYTDIPDASWLDMINRITTGVVKRNMYKYLHLIETLGYRYNPTDNYDMEELSGNWEKDGDIKTTPSGKVTEKNYRTQYNDESESDVNLDTKTETSYENMTSTVSHNHLTDSISGTNEVYNSDRNELDRMTGSKLRRHGNIGVTTTQQMIQSQRDLVMFNIIDVFFNDLEEELLLNTYAL